MAVPHEKIVNLLATSVGEVSIVPIYFYNLSDLKYIKFCLFSDINENNAYINV